MKITIKQEDNWYVVDVEGTRRKTGFSLKKGQPIQFSGDPKAWRRLLVLLYQHHRQAKRGRKRLEPVGQGRIS